MLFELLVSLFGSVIVHRNVSLVEKSEVVSAPKLMFIFCFLLIPFGLNLFFKELFVMVIVYIGIFSVTLILHDEIIAHFAQKTFEKLHFNIVERLILLLSTGKSSSASVKILFAELTSWEKYVFAELIQLLEPQKSDPRARKSVGYLFFFGELRAILGSTSNIGEQLRSFREALRLQNNLRHKSGQALQQCRAQAVVCAGLYIVFLVIAVNYLKLALFSAVTAVSAGLFLTGLALIFFFGGKIRWKT